MATTTDFVLFNSSDWDVWLARIRLHAECHYGYWNHINPDLDVKTIRRSAIGLYSSTWEAYRRDLAQMYAFIVDRISDELYYAVVPLVEDLHPWTLLCMLQDRVAPTESERLHEFRREYDALCKTPEKKHLFQWLTDWELVVANAQRHRFFGSDLTIPVSDFLSAIQPIYPQVTSMMMLLKTRNKVAEELSFTNVVQMFREVHREAEASAKIHDEPKTPDPDSSALMLHGSDQNKEDIMAELREQLKEELMGHVKEHLKKLEAGLREELKEELKAQLRDELESTLKDQVKNELKRELGEQLNGLFSTTRKELQSKIEDDTRKIRETSDSDFVGALSKLQDQANHDASAMRQKLDEDVQRVCDKLEERVDSNTDSVREYLKASMDEQIQTLDESKSQVRRELDDYKNKINSGIMNALQDTIKDSVKDQLTAETERGLDNAHKDELRDQLMSELRELMSKLREKVLEEIKENEKGRTRRRRRGGKNRRTRKNPPPCICGDCHWYRDCLYLNKALQPEDWISDEDVVERVQTHLTDPTRADKVQRAIERWRRRQQVKQDAGADDDDDNQSDGVALWPETFTHRVEV